MRILYEGKKCHKKYSKRIKEDEIVCWYNFCIERTSLFNGNKYNPKTIDIRLRTILKKLIEINKLLKRRKNTLTIGIRIDFLLHKERYDQDVFDLRVQFMIHRNSISIKTEGLIETPYKKFYSITKQKDIFIQYFVEFIMRLPDTTYTELLKILEKVKNSLM
jgi:hypothetical protein